MVEPAGDDALQPVAAEVLQRQRLLGHLAHRVRAERAQRVVLADGRLVRIHQPVLLARSGDVDDRIEASLADGLEEVHLGDDVVRQRGRWSSPTGGHEALRRQVEDPVGQDGANDPADGAGVLQLAVDDGDLAWSDETPQAGLIGNALAFVQHVQLAAIAQVLEVVQLAAPAEGAEDLDVRVLVRKIFGQEAPDHASNAGDQDAHRLSSTFSRQYSNVSRKVVCHAMRGCQPVSVVNLRVSASWRGTSEGRSNV